MDDIHLSREILHAVDNGRLPQRVLDEIKHEHLLSRCPHCRAEVEAYEAERRAKTSVLSRLLRSLSVLLGRLIAVGSGEILHAERELRELLPLSTDERRQRIERARNRFRSSALARLLVEESWRRAPTQPTEAFHFAELARRVVNLNPKMQSYFDLYVLSSAHMANACRVGNDRRMANDLFLLVRQVIAEHGVTDPEIIARVDDLQGSLRKDQRLFPEAERLLSRAAMQFSLIRSWEDAARVLINLGDTYRSGGNLDKAIETTQAALDLLHPEADPKLLVAGHYNLTLQLVQAERFEEAFERLEADEGLYGAVQEPWLQLRLLWLRGDIAAGRGDFASAEQAYLATRAGFIAQEIGYDAAIVSLDLAVLYLRQGRTADVRRLAEEMIPLFETQDVHREALAALTLFLEAARRDQLTVERTLEIASVVRSVAGLH